ncbi:MAG: hypothetical protein EA414_17870 [Arthrospira sp. PLM2.Bin9]|nr:hypothetical protein [Arthrospira sp. PLM2.Bin9]TVU52374.1 MAG: hypothetical protein EA414_17870 [Arthrospira sp. PLM2.Bin9]
MNNIPGDRHNRPTSPEEQELYNHWLEQVETQSTDILLERFRLLFIQGTGYPNHQIVQLMRKLLRAKHIEGDFNFIINRCCYILINRWHTHPERRQGIYRLVDLFDSQKSVYTASSAIKSRYIQQLSYLVNNFRNSPQYQTMKRFAEVLCEPLQSSPSMIESQPLRTLIPRYPYLYRYCLINDDSPYEHQQMIQTIKLQKQKKFELELSKYALYQMRQNARSTKPQELTTTATIAVTNPTLLSNEELFFALQQFVGKVQGSNTYRDLAHRFISHTNDHQTFRDFKSDLYEYLSDNPFKSSYLNRQFYEKLYKQLQNTIPQSDEQPFNEFLMLRTCSQLLNYLVVESPQKPQHFVFIDLIANIGPTFMVSLLLKIVLLCRQVKPSLEKRFSVLFNHYESSSTQGLQWLVKVLENLNVALTTNFGKVDLSFIR